jgi:hypothetical protein
MFGRLGSIRDVSESEGIVTTLAELIATLSSGLFAGAAVYINLVEHPARMQIGIRPALTEFAPSYHRATVTQVSLAVAGFLSGLVAWRSSSEVGWLIGSVMLVLLTRWGRLHAVRSVASLGSLLTFLFLLTRRRG